MESQRQRDQIMEPHHLDLQSGTNSTFNVNNYDYSRARAFFSNMSLFFVPHRNTVLISLENTVLLPASNEKQ